MIHSHNMRKQQNTFSNLIPVSKSVIGDPCGGPRTSLQLSSHCLPILYILITKLYESIEVWTCVSAFPGAYRWKLLRGRPLCFSVVRSRRHTRPHESLSNITIIISSSACIDFCPPKNQGLFNALCSRSVHSCSVATSWHSWRQSSDRWEGGTASASHNRALLPIPCNITMGSSPVQGCQLVVYYVLSLLSRFFSLSELWGVWRKENSASK